MEPIFEIKEEVAKDNYSKFVISPLVQGFGNTMGVSLRRVLLSSLPGAAITSVKISGVSHRFSTLNGMKEDVLDFLLNLKKVRFYYNGEKVAKVKLSVKKVGEVKAGDFEVPSGVEVVNKELVLANLSKGAKLEATMTVESGVGYLSIEDRTNEGLDVILLDAIFSPVVRVNYKVEETRVGRRTNFDKLVFEIWTDGTISPKDALVEASKILIRYFSQVVNPKKIKLEKVETKEADAYGPVGQLSVEEIGLPTRVANALSRAGYTTVAKLASAKLSDLIKVRNLGEKSIDVIKVALKEKGVSFS